MIILWPSKSAFFFTKHTFTEPCSPPHHPGCARLAFLDRIKFSVRDPPPLPQAFRASKHITSHLTPRGGGGFQPGFLSVIGGEVVDKCFKVPANFARAGSRKFSWNFTPGLEGGHSAPCSLKKQGKKSVNLYFSGLASHYNPSRIQHR